ncbi:CPBP family intramembrane metalloprotease [Phragmitibacter flavus]|uniref:CPBP family intramembrane metalloprotease n=1 Tax=Phragmitibacter flavus TaxID=2576071 RepID=A0A5R8KHY5_9BACT|nr:CPBP family intramembrane glutamic endopeptidase [Phragmitibacter flavus]TLD71918.1 CPBP family intramembrane metalloprotease [Phragmitibacter flavus]
MSPELTQAVLLDVLLIAALALSMALVIYTWVGVRTGISWIGDGNVLARPYGIPDAAVALGLVALFGWMVSASARGPEETMEMESFAIGMFVGSMFFLLLGLMLVAYMSVLRGMNPTEMFGLRSISVKSAFGLAAVWIVGVVVVMALIVAAVYAVALGGQLPDESPQEVVEMFRKMDGWMMRGLVVIAAVLVAPLTEELIFRGFLYGVTKRFTERWFAVLLTALLFATVHNHVGSLLPLFLLGVGFAVAYEATGSLLVPIFMHMIFNGFNVVRMIMMGGE